MSNGSFWKRIDGDKLVASDRHLCGFECWNPKKPSLLLLCSDGEKSHVIEHIGLMADYIMSEYPDPHLELEGIEAGIWVVTIRVIEHRDYYGEYDEEVSVEELRKLTEEEWELLQGNDVVLDDTDYYVCEECKAKNDMTSQEEPDKPSSLSVLQSQIRELENTVRLQKRNLENLLYESRQQLATSTVDNYRPGAVIYVQSQYDLEE